MKLEIINSEDGMNSLWLSVDNSFIRKNLSGISLQVFDEDDIKEVLGSKRYKEFLNGKYEFTITKSTYNKIWEWVINDSHA